MKKAQVSRLYAHALPPIYQIALSSGKLCLGVLSHYRLLPLTINNLAIIAIYRQATRDKEHHSIQGREPILLKEELRKFLPTHNIRIMKGRHPTGRIWYALHANDRCAVYPQFLKIQFPHSGNRTFDVHPPGSRFQPLSHQSLAHMDYILSFMIYYIIMFKRKK